MAATEKRLKEAEEERKILEKACESPTFSNDPDAVTTKILKVQQEAAEKEQANLNKMSMLKGMSMKKTQSVRGP